ncbi:MAG: hypothetical protein K9N62_02090 [Verrucomicrobia bacterium]|nr:hypothetical protein [Verrucomicrobiota bacterium]
MNVGIKIALYIILISGACFFGYKGYESYTKLMGNTPETKVSPPIEEPVVEKTGASLATQGYSQVMGYGGGFFIVLLCLAFLLSHDVTNYLGNRVLTSIYNDEGEGLNDTQYEIAEQVWADGNHLEAIRLMREYLSANPREQHVAIRIAEIYEKDLQNNLAAALEYEDILKQKLQPERWGWSAIHLCNLYFRLNQPEKALELLRRIDTEYGDTPAAEKARKRLALYESEANQELADQPAADEEPQS